MHHGLDVVLGEDVRERSAVEEIANHQWTVDEAAVAGRQVVVDNWLVARGLERAADVRADIARAARDENGRAIVHGGCAMSAHGTRQVMGNAKCPPTAARRKPAGSDANTHRRISLTGAACAGGSNFTCPGNVLLTKKLYHLARPTKGL